jgi:ankyrin repeat protein
MRSAWASQRKFRKAFSDADVLGETPLHKAAWCGDTHICQVLISELDEPLAALSCLQVTDITTSRVFMTTPLACAVVNGHVNAVKCLLEQHQSVIEETTTEVRRRHQHVQEATTEDCHEAALLTALLREHIKISELIIDNSDMGVFKSVNTLCSHYPQNRSSCSNTIVLLSI